MGVVRKDWGGVTSSPDMGPPPFDHCSLSSGPLASPLCLLHNYELLVQGIQWYPLVLSEVHHILKCKPDTWRDLSFLDDVIHSGKILVYSSLEEGRGMSTMDTPTNSDHTHTLATPLSSPLPVVVMSTTKHSRDSSSVGDSNDWTV